MNNTNHLNEEQALAVRHTDGPMLVLAGPGSGKTKILTERILFLIEEHNIPPEEILVLTFSKKAASEMQQRFFRRIENKGCPVNFGTFHAASFHILKHERYFQENNILNPIQKRIYIEEAGRLLQIQEAGEPAWQEKQLSEISRYKNAYENPSMCYLLTNEEQAKQFLQVYEVYQTRCRDEGMMDFDDILIECFKLLNENPEILKKWQETYRYLLVDEFQDSNSIQYEILKVLAGSTCNLFAVGDEDQSVYAFRGASPNVMHKLIEDFPSCRCVTLSYNYRCDAAIIKAADALIANNTCRIGKKRQNSAIHKEETGTIMIREFSTMEAEATFVAEEIKNLVQKTDQNINKRIAVLYRVACCANLIEEKLILAGLVYERQEEHKDFYEEEWVVDLLTYLKIAAGSRERTHIYRILNKPKRGLSRECIAGQTVNFEEMLAYYRGRPEKEETIRRLMKDLNTASQMAPFAAVTYIFKRIGYDSYLCQKLKEQGKREEEVRELTKELLDRSREFHTIEAWLSNIEKLMMEKDKTIRGQDMKENKASIVLQTIHAAKGLEYDTVFVIGLQEGILPHKKAMTKNEMEEERRLLYVAMTRAKNRLYLCARGEEQCTKGISRFVREVVTTD